MSIVMNGTWLIAFALRTALCPPHSDERISLLAHDLFQHNAYATASQLAQMLPEFLLIRQSWDRLLST